jgi:nitrate reductase gamma subunit
MIIMSLSVPIPMTLITVYSAPATASSTVVANVTPATTTPVFPGYFIGVVIGGILLLIAIVILILRCYKNRKYKETSTSSGIPPTSENLAFR